MSRRLQHAYPFHSELHGMAGLQAMSVCSMRATRIQKHVDDWLQLRWQHLRTGTQSTSMSTCPTCSADMKSVFPSCCVSDQAALLVESQTNHQTEAHASMLVTAFMRPAMLAQRRGRHSSALAHVSPGPSQRKRTKTRPQRIAQACKCRLLHDSRGTWVCPEPLTRLIYI